jgi:phytoene dehydrogenase-like protein
MSGVPTGGGVADVVVIGAGHNALVAAAYLGAAGLQTVVLEERELVGGNTITEQLTLPGYQHDSCSSAHVLIQSNPLIRDDELGLKSLGLQYVHTDPAVVLPFRDGSSLVVHRDGERTAMEIARWSESDADSFLQLLDDWHGGLSAAHSRWNTGALDPAASRSDAAYAELRAASALDTIRARFHHPRTIDAMAWMSFATIQRVDRPGTGILPLAITAGRTSFGWSTPIGGSGALPAALVRRIEKDGGAVHTGQLVEQILVEGGRAVGVQTAQGDTWRARRAVLSSAHLTQLPSLLADSPVPPALARAAASWRSGLSLFAAHFATSGQLTYPSSAGAVTSVAGGLGSAAGMHAQYDAFDRGHWDAVDPWLLIVCSTVVDPDRAPDGHGTVKFLTIAPYTLSGGRDWAIERERYVQALLAHASGYVGGLDADSVLAQAAESPPDLERRNRHNVGGSCHGGEFRTEAGEVMAGWPEHRLPVPGLYQTGSTTHPGGSVAGRSGRNAARLLLTDLGINPGDVMGGE